MIGAIASIQHSDGATGINSCVTLIVFIVIRPLSQNTNFWHHMTTSLAPCSINNNVNTTLKSKDLNNTNLSVHQE